jgi:hypothetical protein
MRIILLFAKLSGKFQRKHQCSQYALGAFLAPGAGIGARRNLVGTGLTYLTAGVTLFNLLNIDIAGTVETTSINDQTRPRGLIANIGFNVLFQ